VRNGASGAELRDVNRTAVLRLIGRHGPISRADIARRLGVSPATVTVLTRNLIESRMIRVLERGEPSGGRPAELLGLVGSSAAAIGVKVAHDHVAVVRADLEGAVAASETVPFDAIGGNPFGALAELLEPHLTAAPHEQVLLGIGLGVPGFEDPYGSGIVQAPLLRWRHLPLGDHLTRVLGVPVLVDNDVNTLAVAQSLYGTGRGIDDFLTVTLGRGVGMGIVLGGELYRGARGAAGEFGHVDVGSDVACSCGKRGCLETVVAEPALVATARRRRIIRRGATAADLLAAAVDGSRGARTVYADAGAVLGRALAAVTVVLNPQAVLISGEGSDAWPFMAATFHDRFAAGVFPPVSGSTAVHVEPWDDATWALGAAALVLRAPFVTPLHEHPIIALIRNRFATGGGSADRPRSATW